MKKRVIEASVLRRNLFSVLDRLAVGETLCVTRRGHVVATLGPPPKVARKPVVSARGLARTCRQHHIQRLALFGSILRDDFGSDSDVDILVDPEPGHMTTIGERLAATNALARLFKRPVDLVKRAVIERTPDMIRCREILNTAKVIYEARGA